MYRKYFKARLRAVGRNCSVVNADCIMEPVIVLMMRCTVFLLCISGDAIFSLIGILYSEAT